MKARFFAGWKWLLVVGGVSSLLMAFDNPDRLSSQVTSAASPKPSRVAAQADDKPNTAVAAPEPATDLEAVVDKKSAPKTLPEALKNLSPGMEEIIKLAQGGVGETVLLAYINNSRQPYSPTVDEILFLTDLGVADTVIASLVRGNPPVPVTPTPGPATATPTLAELPAPPATNAVPTPAIALPATQTATFETQPVNISYYYSSLAPYGSWINVGGYGYCWQPTVCTTTPGWRPYANRGHWIYTDAGWYWQSDYSWGWAAFHYGRWDYHNRHGWVWCPGSTWAPSWVTWRSHSGYAGWAPLPSSVCYDSRVGLTYRGSSFGFSLDIGLGSHYYTFIPTSRFCDRQPYNHYVSGQSAHSIYQNSTVINNYITGNNNTVINEGIGRDRIASATRTDIRRVNIQSMETVAKEQGRRELLDQNRNTLTVYRPHPAANQTPGGAGSTVTPATPAFAKLPPIDRRITIPTTPDQHPSVSPIQKPAAVITPNATGKNPDPSTQPPTFTKLPPSNRRIAIPAAADQDTVQNNPAANSTTGRTTPSPRNSVTPPNSAKNTSGTQPPGDTRVPVTRPSAPNYANNSVTPTVPPSGQPNRSTPTPVAVNPDTRSLPRTQPSVTPQPRTPVSGPSEPRPPSQITPQPRPAAPAISAPVQPRVQNYTAPAVRPTIQPAPSQPAPAPTRVSTAPPPQSQPQPALQNGGRNSYSQESQSANPGNGGSVRSR